MIKAVPHFFLILSLQAALPEEYGVTDIAGWSSVQLAALPYFDHWVPQLPAGASGDFEPIARNGPGLVTGNRSFTGNNRVQGSGAYVENGAMTSIPAWLRPGFSWSYSWSRTWFDGEDVHFQNGFVTHSPVRDVNILGEIVGYATRPGSGSSGNDYVNHVYLRDTTTGAHLDLTPEAHRADPRGINDLGEITGSWSNESGRHPFRRSADGIWTDFTLDTSVGYSLTPAVINNHGHVAGEATVYTVPTRDRRPFFSERGSETIRLPLPGQNSPDVATIADINNHSILVGEAHKSDAPSETSGVRWAKVDGVWMAWDLNELLADHEPEVIVDRAIAINDAGYLIVSGHLDGTDTPNTRTIFLSPDTPSKPTASGLKPEWVGSASARIRGVINPCDRPASYVISYGPGSSPEIMAGSGNGAGTRPVLTTLTLEDLTPNTRYSYRVSATNSEGTTVSQLRLFTTKYDWPTWAAGNLDGPADLQGDLNTNGVPDSIDYLTNTSGLNFLFIEGSMRLSMRRSLTADGATLILQGSRNLENWENAIEFLPDSPVVDSSIVGEVIRTPLDSGSEEVMVVPTSSYQYFRLKGVFP